MDSCRCGRRRATAADLKRWRDEFPAGKIGSAPDPEWSRELCWTTESAYCHMRPITTTEDPKP